MLLHVEADGRHFRLEVPHSTGRFLKNEGKWIPQVWTRDKLRDGSGIEMNI